MDCARRGQSSPFEMIIFNICESHDIEIYYMLYTIYNKTQAQKYYKIQNIIYIYEGIYNFSTKNVYIYMHVCV